MRALIKLQHNDVDYYLEWSSVVDAPVTCGMSLVEYERYYRDEYGRSQMQRFPKIIDSANRHGISSLILDLEELIYPNRAGKGETCITVQQIIEGYCLDRTLKPLIGIDYMIASEACDYLPRDVIQTKTEAELRHIIQTEPMMQAKPINIDSRRPISENK